MEQTLKKYTNTSREVLRFALDNKDYTVGPGQSFVAPATPYTEGLVAKNLATVEGEPATVQEIFAETPAPETAAGPEAPAEAAAATKSTSRAR